MLQRQASIDGRVLSYGVDWIACTSSKYDSLGSFEWLELVKNRRTFIIDASHAKEETLVPYHTQINRYLSAFGFDYDSRFGFLYSIFEAINNAQEHTLNYESGRKVFVELFLARNLAFAGITASGAPYNVKNAIRAVKSIGNTSKERGRGIYLMIRNCDLFYVSRSGNDAEVLLGKLAF